jgi:hypothetical protein
MKKNFHASVPYVMFAVCKMLRIVSVFDLGFVIISL